MRHAIAVKVLDLQCGNQHVFEGWFGSEDDYASQQARGLISCPLCADTSIFKRLSAPRLNLGHAPAPREKPDDPANDQTKDRQSDRQTDRPNDRSDAKPAPARQDLVAGSASNPELSAAWLALAKRIVANTEDVGDKFAEEARKIHYGETAERGIRGRASMDETRDLLEEGIAVSPLLLPEGLKGSLQ
jgi:hypothetical protein